ERVEKFFLRPLLSTEELNIVDQEQVGLAITFSEFDQIVVLNRVDELVDEKLARKIHHLHAFLFDHHVLADRLHEVRLAEAHAAINKKGVVSSGWRLCNGQARRVRNFVVWADDKRFESVA